MKPSEDKKSIALSISGNLSTQELEVLIVELSVARAHMLPPVPFEVPKSDDPNFDVPNISSQDDPYMSAGSLRDGSFRLWLRSFGYGWMVFTFPLEKACALRDYLVANTPASSRSFNFFADNPGDGSSSH